MKEFFPKKDWNPETMKKEFKRKTEQDGLTEPPKWRSLTPEERAEESKLIDKEVNTWIESVSRR